MSSQRSSLRLLAVVGVLALATVPSYARTRRNLPGFSTNTLVANDDGSTGLVPVGFSGNFFGVNFTSVYVNNNGNITFTSPLSTFTPFGLNGTTTRIIAPFFADVDTRGTGSGLVHYGMDTVDGHAAFGVEWPAVGYFGGHTDKLNTFELVLIDRSDTGSGNFDFEFNYDTIKWETGDASDGSGGLGGSCARAGYSNGGSATFELPGSAICGALLDGGANALVNAPSTNTLFQVRNGVVMQPGTTTLTANCVFAPASLTAPGSTTAPASITVQTGATVTANCGVLGGGTSPFNWTFTNRPSWLLPSSTTGTTISLSGVAPAPPPGTYNFTVTVTDSTSPAMTVSVPLTIIVLPPLSISCNPLNPSVPAGTSLSIACGATGGLSPYSFTYPALPSFLSPSGNTGPNITLSGTVPNPPPTSYTVLVTVRDSANQQAQQTITITVGKGGGGSGPLLLLSCNPTSATVNPGTQFSASCTVSGGTAPIFIIPTNVPAWLSASVSTTGVSFSGIVPSPPPGSYSVGVVATDSASPARTQSQTIVITVNGGRLSLSCSPATISVAAGAGFSVGCSVSGGTGPFSYSYSGFPAGASGPSSGASVTISGTMPGPPPSSYTGVVTVTDSSTPAKQSDSKTISITNTTTVLSISCAGPASVAAGATYSATCTPTGGTPGYTVSFSGLPSFLTASGNTVSGIMPSPPPTSYTFTATATDSTQPSPQSASQTVTVANTTPLLSLVCTPGPSTVTIGSTYSASCTASGGTPSYSFTASGNPAWLTGATSGSTFTLSGTAAAPTGPVNVTVSVTDSGAPTKQVKTATITFQVNPPALQFSCTTATASATAGVRYTSVCTSTGGTPPYNYTFTNGGLPPWLTASATTGASITLSGTPPNPPPATYTFTVVSTDSTTPAALTQSQAFSITVLPGLPQGLTVSTNTAGVTANNANVVITLGAPAATALTGTVQLSFKPDASVTNLPAGYNGSAGVCEAGTGFPAGALVSGPCNSIATVNIPAGASSATIQFSVGTVAGVWSATISSLTSGAVSVLPSPAPTPGTFPVTAGAPVIQSVKILNASNTGFDVRVIGIASRRNIASGSFTFTGTDLTGTQFTVPFGTADQAYFGINGTGGPSVGGAFLFTIHFPYSGDPAAVTGVSVTLTDAQGGTSAAVTGGQ